MPKSRGRKIRKKTGGHAPPVKPSKMQPSPPKQGRGEKQNIGEKGPEVAPAPPITGKPRRTPWLRILEVVFGTLVLGAIALAASAYQLSGGPPWPASPQIEPGMPAYSPAFSIPFEVRNPSSWFSMHRTILECEIADLKTSSGRTVPVLNTQIASSQDTAIDPLGSRPFQCLFPVLTPGETVVGAKLSIMAQWHIALFGMWLPSWEPTIGPFNWRSDLKPPRWIKGEPLR
jgi:hypothetical protein